MKTQIDCDAQRFVTVHGIRVPMVFRVTRGYAAGETCHLLAVEPCHVGGWISNTLPCWSDLPSVAVTVALDRGTTQTYRISRNHDGIVSNWLVGLFDDIAVAADAETIAAYAA